MARSAAALTIGLAEFSEPWALADPGSTWPPAFTEKVTWMFTSRAPSTSQLGCQWRRSWATRPVMGSAETAVPWVWRATVAVSGRAAPLAAEDGLADLAMLEMLAESASRSR